MNPFARFFNIVFTVAWMIVCFGAAIYLGSFVPGYGGFFLCIVVWGVLFATPFYLRRRWVEQKARERSLLEYILSKLPKSPPDHILVQPSKVMIDKSGIVFESSGYEDLDRDQCRDLSLKLFERLGEQYETLALFFSNDQGLNYQPVVRGQVESDGQGEFRAYLVRHKGLME